MNTSNLLLALGIVVCLMGSCRKSYECCYFNSDGEKITEGEYTCGSLKYNQKEADKLEARMNKAAEEWDGSATCVIDESAKSK